MSAPGEAEETPTKWSKGSGEEIEKTGSKPPKGGKEKKKKDKKDRENPDVEPLPGYEGTNFKKAEEIAPPPAVPISKEKPDEVKFAELSDLKEDDCRVALMDHVSENCCYGKKCVQEMTITKVKGVTAFQYTLDTFNESRSTKMKKVPYKGGPVDGPENGTPPAPWSMPCEPKKQFKDEKVKKEVPHTAKVKKCKDCKGRGWEKCDVCEGWAHVECDFCDGSGETDGTDEEGNEVKKACLYCVGSGIRPCLPCGADGRVTCDDCDGYGKLRCFVQLKVKFDKHDDDYIHETTDMPDDLIKKVGGTVIYEQVQQQVNPIETFPVKEVNDHSKKFISLHENKWPKERRLNQRQVLRGVPVTEVNYKWEDTDTRFWVYGNERKVYAPDYPLQCCWGCSIL